MLFSRITNQTHSTDIAPYIFSRIFERAAYYGLISVLFVSVAMNKNASLSIQEAVNLYQTFINSAFFMMLIGGVFGEFVIGNKKAMILGGILMSVGIFVLTTPTLTYYKFGLVLIAIGNGLYAPNLLAGFAKHYVKKEKLFDAGFLFLIFALNFGGFIGPMIINTYRNHQNFNNCFIVAGILMIISVIISFFIKEPKITNMRNDIKILKFNTIYIMLFIIGAGVFWYIMQGYYMGISKVHTNYEANNLLYFKLEQLINVFQSTFSIILSIILIAIFSFIYINRFFKIVIGYIFSITAFSLLFIFPDIIHEKTTILLVGLSIFMVSLGEILITPSFYALISKHSKPRYYGSIPKSVY